MQDEIDYKTLLLEKSEINLLRISSIVLSVIEEREAKTLELYWRKIFEIYGFDFEKYSLIIAEEDSKYFINKIPYNILNVQFASDFSFTNRLLFYEKGNISNKQFVDIFKK